MWNTRAAYAVVVTRRVAKCISAYLAKVDAGFAIRAIRYAQTIKLAHFVTADRSPGCRKENALRKNNNASPKARVIKFHLLNF